MKGPFFTVLIDTYNYGQYVEEAVSSALAQDFPREEREILVVDDGSTDDTAARLRKFGNTIHYLHKPNGGQASAFNYGFEHARGEVVAFLDADDVCLPEKLGRVHQAFEQNPAAGMVYHQLHWWDGANEAGADRNFRSGFRAHTGEPQGAAAISHGKHIVPRVPARGAREIVADTGDAAFAGRCVFDGADHFYCALGCRDGVPGKLPAAGNESVSNKRGEVFGRAH
jgi:glycosyltransferase involved in cell wall biosynthesis